MLVKPQGHLVTKTSWNCLKKSSLICLICCLPKHFKFCFCTPWRHPSLGNIWLQSLPKALLPPLLIPTSAPRHPSPAPDALQIKPEKNSSLKSITCGSVSGGGWRNTGKKLYRDFFYFFFFLNNQMNFLIHLTAKSFLEIQTGFTVSNGCLMLPGYPI